MWFFFSSDLSQSIQLNNIQSLHRAAVVAVGLFTMSYVYRIGEEWQSGQAAHCDGVKAL